MKAFLFSLMGVTCGVLATMVAGDASSFRQALPAMFTAAPSAHISIAVEEEPVRRVTPELPSFSGIVREVNPSVVNIYTTRRVEVRAPASPFFDDPFFRRFFGDEFLPERQRPRSYEQQGLGSGVIVTSDGYILTNHHVIEGAAEIRVKMKEGGREYPAEVLGSDQGTDIAVLKIEATDLPALAFADSDNLEVGDLVLAVGNPFGLGHTVTMGIVSALGRADIGIIDYENFIQTDASINPGNSGGALVNVNGDLVGINTAILSRTGGNLGIGFAVPANLARNVMESLLRHGKVVRGYLGVALQAVTADLAEAMELPSERGVLVSDVNPGSPAEAAGIERGDVILRFQGRRVDSPRQLRLAVGSSLPGTAAEIEVWREGEVLVVQANLDSLPEEEGPLGRIDDLATGPLAGISVRDIDEEARRQYNLPPNLEGALISEVVPDSAAGRVGLRPGHVILEINRQRIRTARDALEVSRRLNDRGNAVLLVRTERGNHYVALPAR